MLDAASRALDGAGKVESVEDPRAAARTTLRGAKLAAREATTSPGTRNRRRAGHATHPRAVEKTGTRPEQPRATARHATTPPPPVPAPAPVVGTNVVTVPTVLVTGSVTCVTVDTTGATTFVTADTTGATVLLTVETTGATVLVTVDTTGATVLVTALRHRRHTSW